MTYAMVSCRVGLNELDARAQAVEFLEVRAIEQLITDKGVESSGQVLAGPRSACGRIDPARARSAGEGGTPPQAGPALILPPGLSDVRKFLRKKKAGFAGTLHRRQELNEEKK